MEYFVKTPMEIAGVMRERGEVFGEINLPTLKAKSNWELLIAQGRIVKGDSLNSRYFTKCDQCGKKFANISYVHAHQALKACGKSADELKADPKQRSTDNEISELVKEQYNTAKTSSSIDFDDEPEEEEAEEPAEPWTMKVSPEDYLKRYPNGPNADLARAHV